MSNPPVAVSAPGKVLLTGGYLVLDREYTGLVFGLDARIHVQVKDVATTSGVTFSEITVRSPQFQNAVWEYGYRLAGQGGGIQLTALRADADLKLNRNPFIETALAYALSYISVVDTPNISPSSITIMADNDYYSTSSPGVSSSQRFNDFGVPLSGAHKTGLGSSAALVTAFTAAVLSYYLPKETFNLDSDQGRRRLHNLAQAAHCAAQGKVGSGFDVASAVYGSCLYRRFSPSILSSHGEPGSSRFAAQLHDIVEETGEVGAWDTEITKNSVKVPKGLRLVMCDVSCGSQTPGMVKNVLKWRKDTGEPAEKIWRNLQKSNEAMAHELVQLAESGSTDYSRLRNCIQEIRREIRVMSQHSGVPIEPPAQTQLLDACSEVEGVVGGVVPGAGGYDAVALVIEDRDEVIQNLKELLHGWKMQSDTANGEEGLGKVSMLGVRQDMVGVKVEDASSYGSWIE